MPAQGSAPSIPKAWGGEKADARARLLRPMLSAMDGADALILITEWNAFRGLDLQRVKELLRQPLVIGSAHIYQPEEMLRRRPRLSQHRPARNRATGSVPDNRKPAPCGRSLLIRRCQATRRTLPMHSVRSGYWSPAAPVSRLASVRAADRRATRVVRRQLLHRAQGNIAHLLRDPHFERCATT